MCRRNLCLRGMYKEIIHFNNSFDYIIEMDISNDYKIFSLETLENYGHIFDYIIIKFILYDKPNTHLTVSKKKGYILKKSIYNCIKNKKLKYK